jgi:hypothetical protein
MERRPERDPRPSERPLRGWRARLACRLGFKHPVVGKERLEGDGH